MRAPAGGVGEAISGRRGLAMSFEGYRPNRQHGRGTGFSHSLSRVKIVLFVVSEAECLLVGTANACLITSSIYKSRLLCFKVLFGSVKVSCVIDTLYIKAGREKIVNRTTFPFFFAV